MGIFNIQFKAYILINESIDFVLIYKHLPISYTYEENVKLNIC
jgi:hypothetical protein